MDDLKIVGNENLILEMYIMQLVHLAASEEKKISEQFNLPVEKNINLTGQKVEEKGLETNLPNQVKNQLKSTNQVKTSPIKNPINENVSSKVEIKSFQDLIDQSNKEKEIELKYDLERNVKLVSFNNGKIDISFNEKLNKNFIKNLSEKLLKWTGERWIISLSKNNDAKSVYEKNQENNNIEIEKFKQSKVAKDIEAAFPDAKLTDIQGTE